MRTFECGGCGYEWDAELQDFIDNGFDCPNCNSMNIFDEETDREEPDNEMD